MEPSIDVVLQALHSLYRVSDNEAKEKASKWLMDVQKSVGAWNIADQLLHLNKDEESSYFAAQTIRTKIQFSFHELHAENYEALCSSLMTHCRNIGKDTKHTIVVQLSLALADLALRVGTWKNAMRGLIQEFSPNEDHWNFLLEILKVFPEEVNCRQLKLGENRRNEIYFEMREDAPVFVEFLVRVFQTKVVDAKQNNMMILSRVFECLSSWLVVYAIPEQVLLSCNLLHLAFMAVSSQSCDAALHKRASDCICSAVISVQELEDHHHLAKALFKEIQGLLDAYHLSVAMNDTEKSINFARIFTEMAESVIEPMAQNPNQGFGDFLVLELLLVCVGHHNYQVADVTFSFWNHLSDHLYEDRNKAIIAQFKPYICRLITALCRLCKYDDSNEDVKDDDADFEEFRSNALELVKDVQFIVGADEIVSQLNDSIREQLVQQSWSTYEAALFLMQAPAKKVDDKDLKTIPSLIQFITSSLLPSVHHVALQNTCLSLIGCFHKWFKNNQKYLELVVPVIIQGFHSSKLAPTSALCMQKLCESCSACIVSDLPTLFSILDAVESICLPQSSTIKLLEAACNTLSCIEMEKVIEGLRHLCSPSLSNLKQITESNTSIKYNSGNDPCLWLDRLASIFKSIKVQVPQGQPNPCFEVFIQSWPVISMLLKKFSSDGRVVEHACRCLRNGIRSLGKDNMTLILPITTQMVEIYKEHLHSCCLYMGSIMVDVYASHPQNLPLFLSMLDEFSVKTFTMIEQINGLINFPDVVDDFFRLALRFVEQCPLAFLEFSGCKTILFSAIHACSISHTDANATVVRFLISLIELASTQEHGTENSEKQKSLVLGLLSEHGVNLVSSVIDACLLKVPTRLIYSLASIVHELLKIDREATIVWIKEALNKLPSHSTAGCVTVTFEQKEKFLNSVISAENEDTAGCLYEDFSLLFR